MSPFSSGATDRHTGELAALLGFAGVLLSMVWSCLRSRRVSFSNWAALPAARPG